MELLGLQHKDAWDEAVSPYQDHLGSRCVDVTVLRAVAGHPGAVVLGDCSLMWKEWALKECRLYFQIWMVQETNCKPSDAVCNCSMGLIPCGEASLVPAAVHMEEGGKAVENSASHLNVAKKESTCHHFQNIKMMLAKTL